LDSRMIHKHHGSLFKFSIFCFSFIFSILWPSEKNREIEWMKLNFYCKGVKTTRIWRNREDIANYLLSTKLEFLVVSIMLRFVLCPQWGYV
jgi:hypothetical protein